MVRVDLYNGLTLAHLERLLLLCNVFEVRNGGRSRAHNDTWARVLADLTPTRLGDLCRRHRIEPVGASPWIKGLTGGSDDHGALFVARTYTTLEGTVPDPAGFLAGVRNRETRAAGRHNPRPWSACPSWPPCGRWARAVACCVKPAGT